MKTALCQKTADIFKRQIKSGENTYHTYDRQANILFSSSFLNKKKTHTTKENWAKVMNVQSKGNINCRHDLRALGRKTYTARKREVRFKEKPAQTVSRKGPPTPSEDNRGFTGRQLRCLLGPCRASPKRTPTWAQLNKTKNHPKGASPRERARSLGGTAAQGPRSQGPHPAGQRGAPWPGRSPPAPTPPVGASVSPDSGAPPSGWIQTQLSLGCTVGPLL